MTMTEAQRLSLKAFIAADGMLNGHYTAGRYDELANALNAAASPDYWVYRSSVPMSEIMLNGFDWTRVDNLSVGKARIWDWMVTADPQKRSIDPSKVNIRAGINAVWVGTQADLNVRAAVYAHCVRKATLVEKVLKSAGNGTVIDGNGDGPATLGAEGLIGAGDIGEIMA